MADGQQTTSYVDGYAGYTLTHLRLNEKAIAEREAYDMFSLENPETACLGRPTPAMIFYADLFPIEIEFREAQEAIEIRGQFFDEVRTVYLDGRGHPPADTRFHLGHSIGRWEGDTLVVDTTNFTENRSCAVPTGSIPLSYTPDFFSLGREGPNNQERLVNKPLRKIAMRIRIRMGI